MIGILPLTTLVFIVLRLLGIISWSWWWVLAPTWAPAALWLLCVAGLFVLKIFQKKKR